MMIKESNAFFEDLDDFFIETRSEDFDGVQLARSSGGVELWELYAGSNEAITFWLVKSPDNLETHINNFQDAVAEYDRCCALY